MFVTVSASYEEDISHWASSSSQFSACSFEPGTTEDVGIALRILGKSQTPFAVKGGGHATNPGFSSTPGVQISITRFSDVSYNSTAQTVTVRAGLVWDDVYVALELYGVHVVGGRLSGVGVTGLILGGGYSWLTNQYGLAVDNVQMFGVVLPNGTVVNVTEAASSDLFFALEGSLNNFGIVTRFTLNALPQMHVWGGVITYTEDVLDLVNLATANFATNNGVIIAIYDYILGQPGVAVIIFYDSPLPSAGLFDRFLAIPSLTKDVTTRSFLSLVQSFPSNLTSRARAIFNTISMTSYPLSLLESVVNETIYWGETLAFDLGVLTVSYVVEPFLPALLSHNTTPSAYPPSRMQDQVFQDAARTSASKLRAQAVDGGQNDVVNAPLYSNYAIFDTPLTDLYGANLPRLQAIKAMVDPDNVMGLAGGFKL